MVTTPEQFADSMRAIAADTSADSDNRLQRALAHCMDALETHGYGEGIRLLHDMLDRDRSGSVLDLNPRSKQVPL